MSFRESAFASRRLTSLAAAAALTAPLFVLTAQPAHGVVNCTVTQVDASPSATEFVTARNLQDILSNPGNACTGFDGTLNVLFTAGLSTGSDPLTWTGGEGSDKALVLSGQGADVTTLSGGGTTRVLDANDAHGLVTIKDATVAAGAVTDEDDRGGCIRTGGPIAVTGSLVTGCSLGNGGFGGGIATDGAVATITDTTFTDNSTGNNGFGGALSASGASLTRVTFAGNTGPNGGAVYDGGELTVTGSIFTDNSGNSGGAINGGNMSITGTTFTGNEANIGSASGGAVYAQGPVTATNSTFANNTAATRGGGLALRADSTLNFVTIFGNTAPSGSQVAKDGDGSPSLTATGSVIGYPPTAADACADFTSYSGTYNATPSGDTSCGWTDSTNLSLTGDQFGLGALAVNDNPSGAQTMLPQTGSSLIDAVPNAVGQTAIGPNATDERGVTRSGDFWIGAAQLASAPTPTPTPTPQRVVGHCVTTGSKRLSLNHGARLLKAGCSTTAGQSVGVSAQLTQRRASIRGDMRTFALFCRSHGKNHATAATGYGDGSRYCKNGKLKIRAYASGLRIRVRWYAPAADGFTPYVKVRTYRT